MLLAWSKLFPSAPRRLSWGAREGLRQHLLCGSRVAVWLSSSLLPAATAFRPSPGCPPTPPSPPPLIGASGTMGLEEAGTRGGQDPEARSLSTEGPGLLPLLHSLTQTPCPGQRALSKCSEIQRACCCVPGSRRGGVLLCGLF